jgi:hypothetical protein
MGKHKKKGREMRRVLRNGALSFPLLAGLAGPVNAEGIHLTQWGVSMPGVPADLRQ